MQTHCRHSLSAHAIPLVAVMLLSPSVTQASDWSVSIAASSNYLVHGLTRSRNEAVVQGHIGWAGDQRWALGVWGSTIDLRAGSGPRQEYDFYIARNWVLGRDWRVTSQLTRYEFRGDSPTFPYDYAELATSISFRDATTLSIAVTPDYSAYSSRGAAYDRTAISYELSSRRPINRFLQLTAGVGHRDLDDPFGASYWYWSGGGELMVQRLSIGISYVGTDGMAERLFGSRLAADTWMATVAMRLD